MTGHYRLSEGSAINPFDVSPDGRFLMTKDAGAASDQQPPTVLLEGAYFRTTTGHTAYDVASDGRFLMLRPEEQASRSRT